MAYTNIANIRLLSNLVIADISDADVNGSINKVRIYDRALTSGQIKKLFRLRK